jgi:hypothetical protein
MNYALHSSATATTTTTTTTTTTINYIDLHALLSPVTIGRHLIVGDARSLIAVYVLKVIDMSV